jgi:hypothetical protein
MNNDSHSDCTGDVCGPTGKQARLDAISSANAATVAFVAGGALVAGGVTLFLLGQPHSSGAAVTANVAGGPERVSLGLSGAF